MEQIGRYLVRGEIGKGGFGVVYRAWDPVMRRDVAIKVLTSFNDPGMLARFRLEPATTGILKHKNIITVYDFGEHESAPYLVMELIEGRSLREVIETGPPLPLPEKVGILGEIARGLLHAHQNGVIHRDVKPANIMLLRDGEVKILDFGIARMANTDLTRQTSAGVMVGTPQYMAPEQFAGEDATALSDIFGYGVVCYELLSGEQPFRGPHVAAVAHFVTTKVPAPLRTLVPDCPEALESIVQTAMAKRCSDRYQSLQELLFDLAPIEAEFRKNRLDDMAAKAQESLESGDLETAQKLVWRALELEPNHPQSQELRRSIQRLRERPALEERWKGAVAEVEALLRRNSFNEAIQALEAVRGWLSADSVGDLRADLEARLAAVRQAREKAQRIAVLLAEAQEAAGRHDLSAASRRVSEVLSLDAGNTVALALAGWVAVETGRAREQAGVAPAGSVLHQPEAAKVSQKTAVPEAMATPRADSRAALRPSRQLSRRWILAAVTCGVLVVGVIGILWRQASRLPEPGSIGKTGPASPTPADGVRLQPGLRPGALKVNPTDRLTYVWIPPGAFQMGCSQGDSECYPDEKPAHQVTIMRGFWIGQTEVTQAAWQRVKGTAPSFFKGVKLPVEDISWDDARGYCQAVGMRLPTEAEWEYAARADSIGSRYGALNGIAWYIGNSRSRTHEVGGKQANAWGLYDTLGNVWEWVADWYADQYPPGPATDPQGPASGKYRVLRGGAWHHEPRSARASYRTRSEPANHNVDFGLRCGGN